MIKYIYKTNIVKLLKAQNIINIYSDYSFNNIKRVVKTIDDIEGRREKN